MKQLFFATRNKNKIENMEYRLRDLDIKLITPYKTWVINRRYREFVQLRKNLESKNIKNLPKLPPRFFGIRFSILFGVFIGFSINCNF